MISIVAFAHTHALSASFTQTQIVWTYAVDLHNWFSASSLFELHSVTRGTDARVHLFKRS